MLLLRVIDSTTNCVKHPELVAQRIVRYANIIGRENVITCTDCGLAANIVETLIVAARIAWAKVWSLVEGARRASELIWE